jgi:hypothetical protein
MDDPDMGVVLSVTSLVMALVQDNPDAYRGSYVKAAQRLRKIVVENDISPDYLYYKVPCPWIQVKFLRLLQFYPPSGIPPSSYPIWHVTYNLPRGHPCSRHNSRLSAANPTRSHRNAKKCTTK